MSATRETLQERLRLAIPIIQAPMAGGGDTPELIAAASNAGGLGSLGAAYLTPEQIIEKGEAIRRLTSKPFAVNLFAPTASVEAQPELVEQARLALAPFYEEVGVSEPALLSSAPSFNDQFEACLAIGAAVFSFTFGQVPQQCVAAAKQHGMLVMGTATTVREAILLEQDGVDVVIAQGSEAGGHRGTFCTSFDRGMIGLFSLLPQIVDAVTVPVIASGGIMDGRGIVAAMTLGASMVQMGTAFLVCEEAGVTACYKDAVLRSSEEDTELTSAFSGRPARGIRNRFTNAYRDRAIPIAPFPLQNALTRPLRSAASAQGKSEYLSLWCGQSPRLARPMSATELIAVLRSEIERALSQLPSVSSTG